MKKQRHGRREKKNHLRRRWNKVEFGIAKENIYEVNMALNKCMGIVTFILT